MSLSRRTWLWTSTAALAAACTRPGPTKLPIGVDGHVGEPEGPRVLSQRGAQNLIALVELGAAIRWLHPSDQARSLEWEPLLLDGVRSIEGANTRLELVEGLRGLFAEVAPTVVVWRSAKQTETEALDRPACADPDEVPEDTAKPEDAAKPEDTAKPEEPSRARDPEETHGSGRPPSERPKPPVRTTRGEPSDAAKAREDAAPDEPDEESKTDEPEESKTDEPEDSESESEDEPDESKSEDEPDESKSEDEPDGSEDAEAKAEKAEEEAEAKAEKAEEDAEKAEAKAEKAAAAKAEKAAHEDDEPAPPVPAALFASDEALTITQWYRRGYADGSSTDPGCARRVEHDPELTPHCTVHPARKRDRRPTLSCSSCDAIEARPLAPAAPLRVELPRGLTGLVPLGLWTRAGQTLPPEASPGSPERETEAPSFGETEAFDYSLEDRGTRLLAVLRTWALIQRFGPRGPSSSAIEDTALHRALCAAAEDPSAEGLRATLETLLASVADGNAALIVATGKSARRFVPALSLAWVEDRVVVAQSGADQAKPGDVVRKIDGVSIDMLLAEGLARTPAASPSAAIERAVATLLERGTADAAIELELTRTDPETRDERELVLRVLAGQRSDRRRGPSDARPRKPIVELEPGCLYIDATRARSLARASSRVRHAERVILDLRGELADARASMLAHWIAGSKVIATERMPTGPDPHGELPLEPVGERRVEAKRPQLRARVIVLADARTRGRAELELVGFEQLGAEVVGSASAGDLGGVATAWLPGGWQLRFSHSELRRPDGTALFGHGVRPTIPVTPTLDSVRRGEDRLLAAAIGAGVTPEP